MAMWKCVDCDSVEDSDGEPVCCTEEMIEYERKHETSCCCC